MPPCRLSQLLPASFFLSLLYMNIMMSPDIFLQVQNNTKKKSRERKSCTKGNEASNAVLCSSSLTFTGFDWSAFMNYYRGLVPAWLGCCWSKLAGQVVQFLISDDQPLQWCSTEEVFRSEVSRTKQAPSGSLTSCPDLCCDMIVAGECSVQLQRVHFHFRSKSNVCGVRVLQSSPEVVKAFTSSATGKTLRWAQNGVLCFGLFCSINFFFFLSEVRELSHDWKARGNKKRK